MKKKMYFIIVAFFIIDQFIKFLISDNMFLTESISVIPHFFNITYVINTGGAWSIFSSKPIFLILVSILALIVLIVYLKNQKAFTKYEVLSYSFVIAGILGNLTDRIIRGAVVDYFDFRIFGYYFPVFNIADVLIVIGVLIMIFETFLKERGR